jgi:hypothetical protein
MKFPAISRIFSKRLVPDQTIVGIFDNDRDLDKADMPRYGQNYRDKWQAA